MKNTSGKRKCSQRNVGNGPKREMKVGTDTFQKTKLYIMFWEKRLSDHFCVLYSYRYSTATHTLNIKVVHRSYEKNFIMMSVIAINYH